MKKCILNIVLACLWTSSACATVFTGVMDNRPNFPFVPGLTGQTRAFLTGGDARGGLRLEWQVDNETTPGSWTYSYRLTRGAERNKGFAFFDIETAADFTAANIISRQVISATDGSGLPIPSGLGAVTISDPVNFDAVHDFSNPTLTETSVTTALNKSELSHYSGDPGRVAPGVPGSPASATPSVGPVPHPFYGIRVTFPGSFLDLAYEASEWEFRIVSDRVPMWGKVFGWADQTILTPFWYANFYNDNIDNPVRLALPASNSLSGADPYRGWVLVPGSLPTVISTNPAAEAVNVPITEPVSAVFDGIMNASSITTETYILLCGGIPVSGTVSYSSTGKSATFLPASPLPPSSVCTATITTGVADLGGHNLAAPKIWNFTTGVIDSEPPTVTTMLPADGARYLSPATTLTATFSEAMDPATLTTANMSVAGVSGTVGYDAATRTAIFTPGVPLASNATYTATIGTGVTDLAGNALPAPVTWSVTTIPAETVLPYVTATFPAARSVNVVTTTNISATFSEAVDPATVNSSNIFVTGVVGTLQYDSANFTITLTPAAPLAFNTSYTLTVTTGVRDLAGNPVGLTKNFTFRTLSQTAVTRKASGTVTGPGGVPLAGVQINVSPISQSGTSVQKISTDAAGNFTASSLLNGTYLFVPTLSGTLFTPRSISASVTTADVAGLNFVGNPLTLTPGVPSPQAAGTQVSFTASVVGGTQTYEYQFWLKDTGGVYTLVQPYSVTNAWNWNTSGLPAGSYSVTVQAKAAGTSPINGFEAEKTISFTIAPAAVQTMDVSVSPATQVVAGTPLSISAVNVSGGNGSYLYQFWLKNPGGSYSLSQAYSASSSRNLDTTGFIPGVYSMAVQVKSTGSISPNGYDLEKIVQFIIAPTTVQTMDVTISPATQVLAGTQLSISAVNVSGGSGTYEYQFWLKDTNGIYTLSQAYSSANIRNLDTTGFIPGAYSMAVQARSVGSNSPTGFDLEKVTNFIIAPPPVTSMDILTSPASLPAAGGLVTVTAANTAGGSGNYLYRFWLKNTAGVYSLMQPFSSAATWGWNTTGLPNGTYSIAVQARSAGSIAAKGYDFEKIVRFIIGP